MNLRLANMDDLQEIKDMFREIVDNMNKNNINIWDEIYPCEFFKEDIEDNRLYIMEDNKEIVSVFVLCDNNAGENSIIWKDNSGKVLYIDRLGVNVKYLRKGIGSVTLNKAISLAKDKGAKYLRLFVVDTNTSEIEFYEKNRFVRADGVYDEVIDEELILHEFGYEKLLEECANN